MELVAVMELDFVFAFFLAADDSLLVIVVTEDPDVKVRTLTPEEGTLFDESEPLRVEEDAVSSLEGVHHFVTLGVHQIVEVYESPVTTVTGPPVVVALSVTDCVEALLSCELTTLLVCTNDLVSELSAALFCLGAAELS